MNVAKKREEKEIVELYYDFQKAYDNVNHSFLEKLLNVYGFPPGVRMLIIEMMARWKIGLSYGAKKGVGEVRLANGIIPGDVLSPPLFVLMIDPLINMMKSRLSDRVKVLYYMDDLKASVSSVKIVHNVRVIVKRYANAVGMVINEYKSSIQLSFETPLPESLKDNTRLDETTYKYLGFEMKKGEVARNGMMMRLEEMLREKLEEPRTRVEAFKAKNLIRYVNKNITSVVRFYSGPVKFTIGWLDRVDMMIRQHLSQQGLQMNRGMATSHLFGKSRRHGLGA